MVVGFAADGRATASSASTPPPSPKRPSTQILRIAERTADLVELGRADHARRRRARHALRRAGLRPAVGGDERRDPARGAARRHDDRSGLRRKIDAGHDRHDPRARRSPPARACSTRISAACRRSTPTAFSTGTARLFIEAARRFPSPLRGGARGGVAPSSWNCLPTTLKALRTASSTRAARALRSLPLPAPTRTSISPPLIAYPAAIKAQRASRGEKPVGWKVGFTNSAIWADQGLNAPIWGPMYDVTVFGGGEGAATFSASRLLEPRIEPEIGLRLASVPKPGMDESNCLNASMRSRMASKSCSRSIRGGNSNRPMRSRRSACMVAIATDRWRRSRRPIVRAG